MGSLIVLDLHSISLLELRSLTSKPLLMLRRLIRAGLMNISLILWRPLLTTLEQFKMQHSQALEAQQLRHMRAGLLPRPCNPQEAASLRPLMPVMTMGSISTMFTRLIRPASGKAGEGARANLDPGLVSQYEGLLSGGPNPATWNLFNNFVI